MGFQWRSPPGGLTLARSMLPFLLTLLAGAYLAVMVVAVARRRPAYRHARHSISELGEQGVPEQRLMAFAVFLPVGVLLLLAGVMLRPVSDPAAALALSMAVGYLVAAAFPCDPGSPLSGSFRQGIHNVGGFVEYVGGAIALMRLAERLGDPYRVAGLVVCVAIIGMCFVWPWRGLVQRAGEVALFSGLAFAAWLTRAAG